jgi:hypothetical protein
MKWAVFAKLSIFSVHESAAKDNPTNINHIIKKADTTLRVFIPFFVLVCCSTFGPIVC